MGKRAFESRPHDRPKALELLVTDVHSLGEQPLERFLYPLLLYEAAHVAQFDPGVLHEDPVRAVRKAKDAVLDDEKEVLLTTLELAHD